MTNILTIAEARNLAPSLDLSSYSDTTLSGVIAQATQRMAGYCNVPGFDLATETEKKRTKITSDGDLVVVVRRRPLVSVSSINLTKGGFSTAMTLTDSAGAAQYDIPTPPTRVVIPNSYLVATGTLLAGGSSQLFTLKGARTFAQITYLGGWATIPDDLKRACSLFFQDIVTTIGAANLKAFTQGSYREEYDTQSTTGKSEYTKQAEQILNDGGYVNPDIF